MNHCYKWACILPLLFSCKTVPSPQEAAVLGSAPSKFGSQKLPLVVYCSRPPRDVSKGENELSLYMQLDGTYSGFVREPYLRTSKLSPPILLGVQNIRGTQENYYGHKMGTDYYRFLGKDSNLSIDLNYFPYYLNQETRSRIVKSPWKKNRELEYLDCLWMRDIDFQYPAVDDSLYVISSTYDPAVKGLRQVHVPIAVDLLTVDSQNQEIIISSTQTKTSVNLAVGSPVFSSKNGFLVGFLLSHKPGDLLGITVLSVHNSQLRDKLQKSSNIQRIPIDKPKDRRPSQRLLQTLCEKGAGKQLPRMGVGFETIGQVIIDQCPNKKTEGRIEVY